VLAMCNEIRAKMINELSDGEPSDTDSNCNIQHVRVSVCEHPKPWKNTPWGYKVCPECNDIVEWEQTAP